MWWKMKKKSFRNAFCFFLSVTMIHSQVLFACASDFNADEPNTTDDVFYFAKENEGSNNDLDSELFTNENNMENSVANDQNDNTNNFIEDESYEIIFNEDNLLKNEEEFIKDNSIDSTDPIDENITEYVDEENNDKTIKIIEQPADQFKLIDERVEFFVRTNNDDCSYCWYVSKNNGETWDVFYCTGWKTNSISFDVKNYHYGYLFKCEIRYQESIQFSDIACLYAKEPIILVQPQSIKAMNSEKVSFSVNAEGNNLKYMWYYTNGDDNWHKCWSYFDNNSKETCRFEGYNTNKLEFYVCSNTLSYQFRCLIVDISQNEIWTDPVCVELCNDVIIIDQPENQYKLIGETAEFTVTVNNDNCSFCWYYSKNNGETWDIFYCNGWKKNKICFDVKNYQYGYLFKCEIKNSFNSQFSEAACLYEKKTNILEQPRNIKARRGDSVSFSVNAEGNNLKYMWYYTNDDENWHKCWLYYDQEYKENRRFDGYNTNVLTFNVCNSTLKYRFKCLITDNSQNTIWTESASIELYGITIINQPQSIKGYIGDSVELSVEADGEDLKYRWYYSSDKGVSWHTFTIYQEIDQNGNRVNSYFDGYNKNIMRFRLAKSIFGNLYKCKITDANGNIEYSESVEIKSDIPKIFDQPDEVILYKSNSTISLEVIAIGTQLKYQWYYSKDDGLNWEKTNENGSKSYRLDISEPISKNGYKFLCLIKDCYGNEIKSNEYTLNYKSNELFLNDRIILSCERQTLFDTESFIEKIDDSDLNNLTINFDNNINIEMNDVLLLAFSGYSIDKCTKLNLRINDGEYIGEYPIEIEESNYILPISGLSKICSIEFLFGNDSQYRIGNFELANVGNKNPNNLQTGIFNINNIYNPVDIDEGIGYMATDTIYDGKYLYAIYQENLVVYSLENPYEPRIISCFTGLGDSRELAFANSGNTLVVSARTNGVYLLDISDVFNISMISNIETLGFATGVFVEDDYCFIASRNHGVEIYDISFPDRPKFCSQAYYNTEEFYDCSVENGILYVSSWAGRKVFIYDVKDVSTPKLCSTIQLDGLAGSNIVYDSKLYVATGYSSYSSKNTITDGMGNGLEIYDVSNPSNPIWLSTSKMDGRYSCSGIIDHWKVVVSNNIAYMTNTYNGVFIYDISDPAAPVRIDKITINIPQTSSRYSKNNNSNWILPYDQDDHVQAVVTSLTPIDGYFYITTITGNAFKNTYDLSDESKVSGKHRGLYVIESSLAKPIQHIDQKLDCSSIENNHENLPILNGYITEYYKMDNLVSGIAKYNDYYIFAESNNGFSIYNKNFEKVQEYSCEGSVRDLVVANDYLYVSENGVGIAIFKLHDNIADYIDTYRISYNFTSLRHLYLGPDNNYLFVQNSLTSYFILNIQDKECPKMERSVTTGAMYVRNMSINLTDSNKIAVADRKLVTWYGINKNNNLYQTESFQNFYYNERGGITGYGEYAIQIYKNGYVYYKPEELAVMSSADANAKKITKVKGANINGIPSIYENMLIVSDSCGRKITFVDISNLEKPKLITQMTLDGNPDLVYVYEGEMLVSLSHGGVLRFMVASSEEESKSNLRISY